MRTTALLFALLGLMIYPTTLWAEAGGRSKSISPPPPVELPKPIPSGRPPVKKHDYSKMRTMPPKLREEYYKNLAAAKKMREDTLMQKNGEDVADDPEALTDEEIDEFLADGEPENNTRARPGPVSAGGIGKVGGLGKVGGIAESDEGDEEMDEAPKDEKSTKKSEEKEKPTEKPAADEASPSPEDVEP